MSNIRLSVPATAAAGDVIEIKTLIQHPMESGFRRGARGEALARDIITRFECRYDGKVVFSADLHPFIAANPFLTFHIRATHSATLRFTWIDQDDQSWSDEAALTVS